MKKFLRLTAALMAVFAMTNFIACSDGGSSSDDDLTITAESDVKEVEVGKTIELTVVGTDADVTWTSSDTAIATVADGTVTGVKAGEVTITAKAPDGKTGTIKITVKAASSSGDSGSTGGSGSGDSGSTGGSGSGDSGSTGGSGSGDSGSTGGTGSGDSGSTGGSGSGDSGSTGGTGEYKVVYNGEPIDEGTYTLEEAKALANKYELAEGTDYTIDEANKKIVLTDSGMAKVEAAMGGSGGGSGETPVAGEYKVVYAGETVMEGLTQEAATAMATKIGLVEPTDYTINNETKIITLTDSGMAKVQAAESGSGAGGSDPGAGSEPVTYSWSFSDLDVSGVEFASNGAASGVDTDATDGVVAKVKFTSEAGLAYNSDPTGLVLNLTNGAQGGSYNKINPAQSAAGEGATAGAIEPSKDDMVYCELQGPFTAIMNYGANSSSDKTDRTAQIKIGEEITSGPTNSVPAAGASLIATYEGTDTVKVYFGGTNIIRIYDIIIVK